MSNLPQKSESPASQGLGDTIAKFTSATKLDVVAEQIAKAVGAEYTDLNHGDMKSKELDTINTVSAVAKTKRNKYGI